MGRENVPILDSGITIFSFIDSPALNFHALYGERTLTCDQAFVFVLFCFWKGRRKMGESEYKGGRVVKKNRYRRAGLGFLSNLSGFFSNITDAKLLVSAYFFVF